MQTPGPDAVSLEGCKQAEYGMLGYGPVLSCRQTATRRHAFRDLRRAYICADDMPI